MTRREITTEKALTWRNWSLGDVRGIEAEFARLGVQRCYVPKCAQYVGCLDEEGRRVMSISPGYVGFRRGFEPPDKQFVSWFKLSIFVEQDKKGRSRLASAEFCPRHPGYALPASGICDECE